MLVLLIRALIALPKATALRTACSFSTGKAPGKARQVGQTLTFGFSPKLVAQEQKILLLVLSWVCTSKPITTSNIVFPFFRLGFWWFLSQNSLN